MEKFTSEKIEDLWYEFLDYFLTSEAKAFRRPRVDLEEYWKPITRVVPRKGKMRKNGIVFHAFTREERNALWTIQQDVEEYYSKHYGRSIVMDIESGYVKRECPSAFIEY